MVLKLHQNTLQILKTGGDCCHSTARGGDQMEAMKRPRCKMYNWQIYRRHGRVTLMAIIVISGMIVASSSTSGLKDFGRNRFHPFLATNSPTTGSINPAELSLPNDDEGFPTDITTRMTTPIGGRTRAVNGFPFVGQSIRNRTLEITSWSRQKFTPESRMDANGPNSSKNGAATSWRQKLKMGKEALEGAGSFVQLEVKPRIESLAISKSLRMLCLQGRAGLAYVPSSNSINVQVTVEDLIFGSRLSMVDGTIYITKEFGFGIGRLLSVSLGFDMITENYFVSAESIANPTESGTWSLKRHQNFRLLEVRKAPLLGSGHLDMRVKGELEFENFVKDGNVVPPLPLRLRLSDLDFELKF
mmetsp:Transcript_46393/g.74598  ORF Transcript_46393/g.74598 Transcript_46393/m.74598 type:complete len:358 (-) Transcript_46393:37-1110(-)|eukprot:jgi/Bigna1/87982/estExt_fgenesh1_pg.C_260164